MSNTATEAPRRNGVDVATLFATLDAVKGQPEIAKFQFRASNTWVSGTHSRSQLSGFYGAMQEMQHKHVTTLDADHPAVLVGQDHAPTPVEYLLHAIAACLTAGIANIAAARGSSCTRSPRPSRATSTCSASSDSPTARSATATSRSGSPSTSRATPTTRRCAGSSSSPGAAPPSTTSLTNPTPVDRSTSSPADVTRSPADDRRPLASP